MHARAEVAAAVCVCGRGWGAGGKEYKIGSFHIHIHIPQSLLPARGSLATLNKARFVWDPIRAECAQPSVEHCEQAFRPSYKYAATRAAGEIMANVRVFDGDVAVVGPDPSTCVPMLISRLAPP